jgi:hypothetical protein
LYNTGMHEMLQMLHELKFYYQHKIKRELLQENFYQPVFTLFSN